MKDKKSDQDVTDSNKPGEEGQEITQSQDAKETEETEEAEKIDIDLTDPEVQDAAVKIQAGYKGMRTRQEIKDMNEQKEESKSESEQELKQEAELEKTGIIQSKEAKETEEEEIDIDLADPDVENAAIKIQAGYKGMQVRKSLKEDGKDDSEKEISDEKASTNEADNKEDSSKGENNEEGK